VLTILIVGIGSAHVLIEIGYLKTDKQPIEQKKYLYLIQHIRIHQNLPFDTAKTAEQSLI
jgi:hypothetical protein